MTPMDAPIFNFIYLRQGASENTFQQASTLFSPSQKKGHMLVLPESLLPEFEEIIKAGYTGDAV